MFQYFQKGKSKQPVSPPNGAHVNPKHERILLRGWGIKVLYPHAGKRRVYRSTCEVLPHGGKGKKLRRGLEKLRRVDHD